MMKRAITLVLLLPGTAWCGEIRTDIKAEEPVLKAWAIRRTRTKEGMKSRLFGADVAGGVLTARDLPVPGRYDLKIQMESGTFEGWDATVPESDYVEEQPFSDTSRRTILKKMAGRSFTAYWDRVVILDIQGNIQNAVVLRAVLRTRPFVGGNYRPGEWVWRVERWQWEDPMEHTWTTHQEQPYYALVRRRLFEKEHRTLRTTYARHLGGVALTKERPRADLGLTRMPKAGPETRAINPDGTPIEPIVIKPPRESRSDQRSIEDPGGAP